MNEHASRPPLTGERLFGKSLVSALTGGLSFFVVAGALDYWFRGGIGAIPVAGSIGYAVSLWLVGHFISRYRRKMKPS